MGRTVFSQSHFGRAERPSQRGSSDPRLRLMTLVAVLLAAAVCARLFYLMVVQHGFYLALASGTQEVYADLLPERGTIYLQDSRSGELFPLAMNRDYYVLFADTKTKGQRIPDQETTEKIVETLTELFAYEDEEKETLFTRLSAQGKLYIPIEDKVNQEIHDKLLEYDYPGLHMVRKSYRYYPEGTAGAHVVGFVGQDEEQGEIGRYGVEGYWEKELAGSGGYLEAVRSAIGRIIPLAGRSLKPAEDGADLVLTLDRTLQFHTCKQLYDAMIEYEAEGASLIIMDPKTGAIRTMCSYPDFDPNQYSQVESITAYNNTTIFTPYEPGSVIKPIVMAAAINEEVLTPETTFVDTGKREGVCDLPITNAAGDVHDKQTMTGVLERSINTGMVFVAEALGKQNMISYFHDFGFGIKAGIELDREETGEYNNLHINGGDKIDCYGATASYGQGITATPLQMVNAFSVIANGGKLMKPYIVEEARFVNGKTEQFTPTEIRRVLSSRAASLVSGMLVSVIDNGYGGAAQVQGHYLAGKTGTAQIAGPRGGYTEQTNQSFVGFGPVDDPAYAMIIKFEKPKRRFASYTAAPAFGKISDFVLDYYEVPPTRE